MIEARLKLKEELETDSLTRGYAAMVPNVTDPLTEPNMVRIQSDQMIADDLNSKYRGRPRTRITSREVKSAVVPAEYKVLNAAAKSEFLQLVTRDDLDPNGLDAEILKGIFTSAAGSGTRQALVALVDEPISRAAELKIPFVRVGHIEEARAGQ